MCRPTGLSSGLGTNSDYELAVAGSPGTTDGAGVDVPNPHLAAMITIAFILLLAVGLPGLWLVAHKKGVADAED